MSIRSLEALSDFSITASSMSIDKFLWYCNATANTKNQAAVGGANLQYSEVLAES